MRRQDQLRLLYWTFIGVQCLLFAITLASVMIRSAEAFRDYVSLHLSDGYFTIVAFLLALLLGLTVRSIKLLAPLVLAMCLVAAAIFGAVLYSPAWLGILFRSVTLANYAQWQALIMFLLALFPAITGAIVGYLLGSPIHRRIEQLFTEPEERLVPWWERGVGNREQVTGNRE